MKQLACRYAIVQFAPYTETGEFANVGVVLACPSTGTFSFQLQTKKHRRVTDFFADVPGDLYRRAMGAMKDELKRIRVAIEGMEEPLRFDAVRHAFLQLVHPREAIIRFGEPRVVLAHDPAEELTRLFEHYVNHSFATREYIEETMTRRIQSLLQGLELAAPFRPAKLGDDMVHANFQLVQKHLDRPHKVIKAFHLNQSDPQSIFAHGDTWVPRIRRLRQRNLLPEQTLFTVDLPPSNDAKRYAASQEIIAGLLEQRVIVVPGDADSEIKRFALAA